jgi:cysteine desulfurase
VGLGRACAIAERDLAVLGPRLRGLSDRLWVLLAQRIPDLALNGDPLERLPNTLSVRFPNVGGNALLEHAEGVFASTGSACHEGHDTASRVILAMGVAPEDALGTVRLTLGRSTTEDQIDRAAATLTSAWATLTRSR